MSRYTAALIIAFIVASSLLSPVSPAQAVGWLNGWSRRRAITVDSALIDADLTHLPLLLYLSASSGKSGVDLTRIFTDLGANNLKIAVTKDDGTTELYVEVERWDNANNKAWLWVGKSDWVISNATDTTLYLYWDNSHADNAAYVGVTDSAVAENVWDSGSMAVLHMADSTTSLVKDSTTYDNDLNKRAAAEPTVSTSGKIGSAQYFDGSNDYASISDANSIDLTNISCMLWINPDRINISWQGIIHKYIGTSNNNAVYLELNLQNLNNYNTIATTTNPINAVGAWYHVIYTAKQAGNETIYVNGANVKMEANQFISTVNAHPFYVGAANPTAEFYKGYIDEFRVYDSQKSLAWCKADYNSQRDGLLTYGVLDASYQVLNGLTFASSALRMADFARDVSGNVTIGSAAAMLTSLYRSASASIVFAGSAVNWLSAYVSVGLHVVFTRLLQVQVPSGSQLSFGFTYFHLLILIPIIILFILGTRRR